MSENMSGCINCETFQQNLNAFLDGELDEILRAQMVSHTKTCPQCAQELEQMTRLLVMCAEMDEDVVMPLAGQAAWRSAIRDEAKARNRPRPSAWLRTMGTVAAAFVLLIAGTIVYRQQGPLSLNYYGAMNNAPTLKAAQSANLDGYVSEDVAYDESYAGGMRSLGTVDMEGFIPHTEIDGPTDGPTDGLLDQTTGQEEVPSTTSSQAEERPQTVVLRTAVREMETTAFDTDLSKLEGLLEEYDGYYENSATSGNPIAPGESKGRTAMLIARVPSEQLSDFLQSITAIGKTTYASETAEDISGQYYDVQIRLNTYRAQHKRLNELIASAETMDDMIALEDKLYQVQNSIDSLEGQLRGWNSQVARAAVSITLREVSTRDVVQPIGDTLGERVRTGFYDSVNWLIEFLQDMSVFLAILAPQLVIIIPLVILIVVIVRVIRRKKKW